MNDEEKVMLVESDQRSRSAIHQIEEIKTDLKEVKEDQKAIYELTTSVKLIAQNIVHIQEDVNEIKQGQSDLSDKVDNQINDIKVDVETKVGNVNSKVDKIEREPYEEYKKNKHELKIEVLKQVIGYIITGLIGVIGVLIGTGAIKL